MYQDALQKKQYILKSADNALCLLDLLSTSGKLTLTEIAARLDHGKTMTYRLLCTLEQRGYVARGADNKYSLGMRLFTLGNKVLSEKTYLPLVQPLLDELTQHVQETTHLVTWENLHHVILVYEALPEQTLRAETNGAISSRPPHLTSTGIALLSTATDEQIDDYASHMLRSEPEAYAKEQLLEDICFVRAHGYAINNQRFERGMVSISVPVLNTGDQTADFAISVSGPSVRLLDNQQTILEELKRTAQKIRELL